METTKIASSKRHPGEKQCTGEETAKPHRRKGLEEREETCAKCTLLGLCD